MKCSLLQGLLKPGYQKGLMDLNNDLIDFIDSKNKLIEQKKQELKDKKAEVYNPYMESEDE